jgi:hypothetical protein
MSKVFLARFEAYIVADDRQAAWIAAKGWAEKETDGGLWLQSLSDACRDGRPLTEDEVVPLIEHHYHKSP